MNRSRPAGLVMRYSKAETAAAASTGESKSETVFWMPMTWVAPISIAI